MTAMTMALGPFGISVAVPDDADPMQTPAPSTDLARREAEAWTRYRTLCQLTKLAELRGDHDRIAAAYAAEEEAYAVWDALDLELRRQEG